MDEQLIPLSSPHAAIAANDKNFVPISKDSLEAFADTESSVQSPGGSDYSVIDYNIPNMFAHEILSSAEKHSRSVNNSPQKVLKKVKYDTRTRMSEGDEDSFYGYAPALSDKENMPDDPNLSGFSDVTIIAPNVSSSRQGEEELAERATTPKRASFRGDHREENVTPTKGSTRALPSSAFSQKTVTPRHRETPARLANLSQYSESPDSTPTKTPVNERTTNLLLDFTQQFNNIKSYPYNPSTPSRHNRAQSASCAKYARDGSVSPTKQPLPMPTPHENRFLLDFDIPPPPTPRSIPSITPKELESLKSTYLAQLASLKAELTGKDAEVASLKKAVSETEKRYANNTVELRQCREEIEDMSARSGVLESKLQEAAKVLSEARDEIADRGKQIELLREDQQNVQQELDYTKRQLDDAQHQIVDYKHQLASTKQELVIEQQKKSAVSSSASNTSTSSVDVEAAVNKAVAAANATKEADITASVEKVAKELHALYKSKHEQKVTALKSSYNARWEKRVKELEARNADLTSSNNDLSSQLRQAEENREGNLTGPIISPDELETQKVEITKLQRALDDSKDAISKLQKEVELERQEKGELVLAVDELMAMGGFSGAGASMSKGSAASLAQALKSPIKNDLDWKSSSLKGGIDRMANGASAASSRFGLR